MQTTNAGTNGLAEQSDTLVLSFSEPVEPESILAGWSGAATNVVVRVNDNGLLGLPAGNDAVQVWNAANSAALPLGTVDLGRSDYVAGLLGGNVRFGASGTPSTMTMSGNTSPSCSAPTTRRSSSTRAAAPRPAPGPPSGPRSPLPTTAPPTRCRPRRRPSPAQPTRSSDDARPLPDRRRWPWRASAAAAVVGKGGEPGAEASAVAATGDFSFANSREGIPIFSASEIGPGDSAAGTVEIANTGRRRAC